MYGNWDATTPAVLASYVFAIAAVLIGIDMTIQFALKALSR